MTNLDPRRSFTNKQRDQIFARDNYTCRACGYDNPFGEGLATDHVFPWALGGRTSVENGMTLCNTCNSAKKDLVLEKPLPIRKPLAIDNRHDHALAVHENRNVWKITMKQLRNGEKTSTRGKRILKPRS
jgi:5-methylcytosine-specific restriction endonuclease McrA